MIMQVTEKKIDLDKFITKIKLYQTSFTGLTKKISNVPGQTILNAKVDAYVGYQFFHDLCDRQLAIIPKLEKYKIECNRYIDILRDVIPGIKSFDYNFTSLVDYKKGIKEGTKANYQLLTRIVNAEKELYDYTTYARQYIYYVAQNLKEWSKKRNYGSTVGMVRTNYELRSDTNVNSIEGNTYGIAIKTEHYGRKDYIYLEVSDLKKIPVGEECTIRVNMTVRCKDDKTKQESGWARAYLKISRKKLGNKLGIDDGYFSFSAWGEGESIYIRSASHGAGSYSYLCWDKVKEHPSIQTYSGVGSPHFEDEISKITLPWLKDRILRR